MSKNKRSLWSRFKHYEVPLDDRIRETLAFHLPVCMTPEWEFNEYCRALRSLQTIVDGELRHDV